MEGLELAQVAQGGTLVINGAVALILYGIRRDLREHADARRRHWHWIEKLRRNAWPDTFGPGDKEPENAA